MKILLVENDFYLSELLTEVLTEDGFSVQAVFDGLSPLSLVKKHTYDLVILSGMLPKLNGIELCYQLRHHGYSLPILFWSSQDFPEYKRQAILAGADDYLLKPCPIHTLLKRIKNLLTYRQRQPLAANREQFESKCLQVA